MAKGGGLPHSRYPASLEEGTSAIENVGDFPSSEELTPRKPRQGTRSSSLSRGLVVTRGPGGARSITFFIPWRAIMLLTSVLGMASLLFVMLKLDVEQDEHLHVPQKASASLQESNLHLKSSKHSKRRGGTGQLNSLEMPMRRIHGRWEPCLRLVDEDHIGQLQLPPLTPVPLKNLSYYALPRDKASALQRTLPDKFSLRTALFTGEQSLEEREESFQPRDGMRVHCGFAEGPTQLEDVQQDSHLQADMITERAFDICRQDLLELADCQVAVVTATFGGGDEIYQPVGVSRATLEKPWVCWLAFWDTVTLEAAPSALFDPVTKKAGQWRVVLVKDLPFADQRKNGKVPKMLLHRLLPQVRYSIWVDGKSQFRRDPLAVLDALLWRAGRQLAISEHGARSCVYAEGAAVVQKHKAGPEEVERQLSFYRAEGLPENATFDGRKALAEASTIVREHTALTNLFMCLWFNEVVRFTGRDQLSFGHVLRRLKLLHLNMFPVCTRRALVNNMGHRTKPKALDVS